MLPRMPASAVQTLNSATFGGTQGSATRNRKSRPRTRRAHKAEVEAEVSAEGSGNTGPLEFMQTQPPEPEVASEVCNTCSLA